MSRQIKHIISLCAALAGHQNVTHWALSRRLTGKGDFLDRLHKGGDLRTATAERAISNLATSWPEDLEWPTDIPRPDTSKAVA